MNPATERRILEQIAAVRAVGRQVHAETELGDAPIPSDVYASRSRYEAEIARIFFRAWIPVAREVEVSAPGSWIRRSVERADLVITRDEGGALRAFHNTCRHRGATVATGDGCGRRLVCPYHAWAYDLAGLLVDVPERASFPPGFDAGLALEGVRIGCAFGFVWVNLDAGAPPLEAFLGPELFDEFENLALDRLEHKGRVEREGDFDWKVLVENYEEPYHIPPVHRRSLHPLLQTKELVLAWWGDHSRAVIPLRAPRLYEPEGRVGDAPFAPMLPGLNALQRSATFVYVIWPAFVVSFLPNHVVTFQVQPIGPERTRVAVDMYGAAGAGDSAARYFARMHAGYEDFVGEDFAVCTAVQRGLAGPFRPPLVMSQYELRVRHHRSRVESWLERP